MDIRAEEYILRVRAAPQAAAVYYQCTKGLREVAPTAFGHRRAKQAGFITSSFPPCDRPTARLHPSLYHLRTSRTMPTSRRYSLRTARMAHSRRCCKLCLARCASSTYSVRATGAPISEVRSSTRSPCAARTFPSSSIGSPTSSWPPWSPQRNHTCRRGLAALGATPTFGAVRQLAADRAAATLPILRAPVGRAHRVRTVNVARGRVAATACVVATRAAQFARVELADARRARGARV